MHGGAADGDGSLSFLRRPEAATKSLQLMVSHLFSLRLSAVFL
jgi:hypothetical protein